MKLWQAFVCSCVFIGLILFLMSVGGVSRGDVTAENAELVRAIEEQGYQDVHLDDYGFALWWEGCGSDDTYVAHVRATNALGMKVKLIACRGFIAKGVTIRTR